MLTDSYKIIEDGSVSLSGKSLGIDGVGKDVISSLAGGNAVVKFKEIDDTAKELVKTKLGKEYVANDEGFIISVD